MREGLGVGVLQSRLHRAEGPAGVAVMGGCGVHGHLTLVCSSRTRF